MTSNVNAQVISRAERAARKAEQCIASRGVGCGCCKGSCAGSCNSCPGKIPYYVIGKLGKILSFWKYGSTLFNFLHTYTMKIDSTHSPSGEIGCWI